MHQIQCHQLKLSPTMKEPQLLPDLSKFKPHALLQVLQVFHASQTNNFSPLA
jgi:hypothetical protein